MLSTGNRNLKQILKRFHLDERILTLLLAAFIGVLSGYGAVLFRLLIKGTQYLFYGHGGDILAFSHSLPLYIVVGIPCLGGLIVGLIVTFAASEAKGHGVPEVMEAVALRNGVIRKRVAAAKIMASAICIGSGGSVGREGPIVQIGASLGSTVSQVFNVARANQKTMVGCGAAAGIAATSITLGTGGSGGIFAAYALVGMGAVVAGTTHAPITAIIIIFEMSGNYKIILPMMITCILKGLQTMGKLGISQLPVVGGENGRKVIGTLRDKDVIAAYDKAIIRREIEAG